MPLDSDLGPLYGAPADNQRPIGRAAFEELRLFYQRRADDFARVAPGCPTCTFLNGVVCRKFNLRVPDEHLNEGCEEWQFDQIPW